MILYTKWRHLAKVGNPDFAFDDYYGNFRIQVAHLSQRDRATP